MFAFCIQFFSAERRNTIVGRVPIILRCKHTLCEDCVRSEFLKGKVTCPDCKEEVLLEDKENKQVQEFFSINFYVLGRLLYMKPRISLGPRLSFIPAEIGFKSKTANMENLLSAHRQGGILNLLLKLLIF